MSRHTCHQTSKLKHPVSLAFLLCSSNSSMASRTRIGAKGAAECRLASRTVELQCFAPQVPSTADSAYFVSPPIDHIFPHASMETDKPACHKDGVAPFITPQITPPKPVLG